VLSRALPGTEDEVRVAVLGAVRQLLQLGLVEEAPAGAGDATATSAPAPADA
jgi:hypothetical protein